MERITHNVIQGSEAWLALKAIKFGASEAAAMLGMSKQTTRTELLTLKHTGIGKEFSDYVQREILDKGHEVEALARPIVEKLIGEDLSPVTVSYGRLSASSDGVSFMGDIGWENKQYNKAHFEQVKNGELPEVHWPQCQQVIYVHGLEKLFFTISDGTEENTVGVWVYPDAEKQERLINGWAQFEKDLEIYVPVEVIEKPKAAAIMALPTLAIQIKGEVTLSNLPEFKAAATTFIANISTDLKTDEDFSNAEAMVKFCKTAEDDLEATKKAAIAQTSSIDELMRTIDFIKDQLRDKRLVLDKAVKDQKLAIKTNAVNKAKVEWVEYLQAAEKEVHPIRLNLVAPDFGSVISGLKTINSMHSKIADALANSKILIDAAARDIRAKQAWLKENSYGFQFLFNDIQTIIHKPMDDLQMLAKSRIAEHKAAEAEKEAAIKAQAEVEARQKLEAEAEAKRIAEENAAKANEVSTEQFKSIVNTGLSVSQTSIDGDALTVKSVPVAELFANQTPIQTQYFAGATPTANELVCILAAALHVDEAMAHKWLIEADFTQYKKAA
jgi:predicted phage-related endonuclease